MLWAQILQRFDRTVAIPGVTDWLMWPRDPSPTLTHPYTMPSSLNSQYINSRDGLLLDGLLLRSGTIQDFQELRRFGAHSWVNVSLQPQTADLQELTKVPTKHLLARLNPQPVHIVVMGTRRLNIYCCSPQNGQQNTPALLWWFDWHHRCVPGLRESGGIPHLFGTSVPPYRQRLTGSSWQQQQQQQQLVYSKLLTLPQQTPSTFLLAVRPSQWQWTTK